MRCCRQQIGGTSSAPIGEKLLRTNQVAAVRERGGRVTAKEAPDILCELLAMLWAKVVKPIMDVVLTLVTVSSLIDGFMLSNLTSSHS